MPRFFAHAKVDKPPYFLLILKIMMLNQRIALIAAMGENRVIGIQNRLPWNLPADWENFRRVTAGAPFLMGRHSFETEDALWSDYRNVVISRSPQLQLPAHTQQAFSVEEGLHLLGDEPLVFILGGASIFEQTQHLANYMYLTIVHGIFEGDAFFPEVVWSEWELVHSKRHEADQRHAYAFSLNEYQRR